MDKDIEDLQIKIAKKLGYNLVDHKLELYGSKIKNKLQKKKNFHQNFWLSNE